MNREPIAVAEDFGVGAEYLAHPAADAVADDGAADLLTTNDRETPGLARDREREKGEPFAAGALTFAADAFQVALPRQARRFGESEPPPAGAGAPQLLRGIIQP